MWGGRIECCNKTLYQDGIMMDETSVCKIKEQILRDGRWGGFEISFV